MCTKAYYDPTKIIVPTEVEFAYALRCVAGWSHCFGHREDLKYKRGHPLRRRGFKKIYDKWQKSE